MVLPKILSERESKEMLNINRYPTTKIGELVFVETCRSFPEQYEVFDSNSNQVGYVKLRFGYLRVDYPDCGGEVIYDHEFSDSWKGSFTEEEREHYLKEIAEIISKRIA